MKRLVAPLLAGLLLGSAVALSEHAGSAGPLLIGMAGAALLSTVAGAAVGVGRDRRMLHEQLAQARLRLARFNAELDGHSQMGTKDHRASVAYNAAGSFRDTAVQFLDIGDVLATNEALDEAEEELRQVRCYVSGITDLQKAYGSPAFVRPMAELTPEPIESPISAVMERRRLEAHPLPT